MHALHKALTALEFARNRFHELVDPAAQIAKAVEDVAVATANHVKAMQAQIDSLQQQLIAVSNAPAIQSDVGIAREPVLITEGEAITLTNAKAATAVVEIEPVVPVAIPLSAELQAAIDAAPTTNEA